MTSRTMAVSRTVRVIGPNVSVLGRAGLMPWRLTSGSGRRHEVLEPDETVRRRHVARIDLILDEDRDAVERSHRAAGGEHGVQSLSLLDGMWVDGLHGVQRWTGLVVGRDAFEVGFDEPA